MLRPAAALLALAAVVPAAQAQTYTQSVLYEKSGQSMWGTNAAPPVAGSYTFDYAWSKSATIDGITGSPHAVIVPGVCVPGIGCSPDVYGDTRTGAAYKAYTSGSAHFDASAKFTGGTVDVDYHATTAVKVVNGRSVYRPGEQVTLSSSWTPSGGSSFMTTSPTYQAQASFGFALTIGATGKVCSFGAGCDSNGGDILSFDTGKFEVAALNSGGTGGNRILGLDAPGLVYGKPITPGDIVLGATRALSLTPYDGDASTVSDVAAGTLQARGDAYVLRATLDPIALAADHVGTGSTCLLSCSAFGFGYELEGSRFGPVFGYQQDFTFDPVRTTTTYTFDAPVQWRNVPHYESVVVYVPCTDMLAMYPDACQIALTWKGHRWELVTDPWNTATGSVTVPTGQDIDILYPQTHGAPLGVQTSFDAVGELRNKSQIQVTPQFAFDVLSLTTPGGDPLGPVFQKTFSPGAQNLGAFFDQTFAVALGSQSGASFLLDAADPNGPIVGYLPGTTPPPPPPPGYVPVLSTPEPSALALVAGGLLALAAGVARRRRIASAA